MTLPRIEENVPLAPRTTLEVGGAARYLADCGTAAELSEALGWARERGLEVFVLGGGSNLLVADSGFGGLAVEVKDRSLELLPDGDGVVVRAGAGVEWDALVARTVGEGLGGLECLSGIPGRVGAAPIQNVGAYGQEVAETLTAVEVVELASGRRQLLPAERLGFGYRWSRFKGEWRGRYAVTRVDFRLEPRRRGTVRYADLSRRFGARGPSLLELRAAVLEVRRGKSMVLDPRDPNHRSAGSFFLNPVVSEGEAEEVRRRAGERGAEMPVYPAVEGQVKLAAAWLIESAGFERGDRLGRAGISTRHSLALVNLGDATAAEIVELAARIRGRVRDRFGVTLTPEPTFLGFEGSAEEILDRIHRESVR